MSFQLSLQFSQLCRQFLMGRQQRTQLDKRTMRMFTCTARSPFSTDDNIATPCSVKAYGRYRRPP